MRHGLLLVSALLASTQLTAYAFPARFALSPDSSQPLLIDTIRAARSKLTINIYEFESEPILAAVLEKIHAGVATSILIEGEPLGRISPEGRATISTIRAAMASAVRPGGNHLFLMTALGGPKTRRYTFDHAKYVVSDSSLVLVSSENFTATGHARPGDVGNRGWEVAIENPSIARQLEDVFRVDTDVTQGDVSEVPEASEPQVPAKTARVPVPRSVSPIPQASGDVRAVTLVTSPDSLGPIVQLIRSARSHLEIEEMSLPSRWRDPQDVQNPIITELVAAARRGVNVRVMLNDDDAFLPKPPASVPFVELAPQEPARRKPNEITARVLQAQAHCLRVPLSAKIVSLRGVDITYIHNKGIVVDGARTLVSSINLTQNAVMKNREVGLLLESTDAAAYYGGAFDFDWKVTPELPSVEFSCN